MKYKYQIKAEDFEVLTCHFSPCVEDSNSEIGWEETTYISITGLLKTSLAKSSKEQSAVINSNLKPLTDISKLKKHISIVCERLSKGGSMSQ